MEIQNSQIYWSWDIQVIPSNLLKIIFYIKPWAGIGYTSKIAGTNQLEGKEYNIAPITMFATLHVGYTF